MSKVTEPVHNYKKAQRKVRLKVHKKALKRVKNNQLNTPFQKMKKLKLKK